MATTTINHQFTPATIAQGDVSVYRITIANDATVQLTEAAVTSLLAPNITIAAPLVISNTCGFTVDPIVVAGGSSVVLTNGTIPAQVNNVDGQCFFEINVTSITPGNHVITIPANSTPDADTAGYSALQDATLVFNGTLANATLVVNAVQAPTGSKTFAPSPAIVGNSVTLSIVLSNPNPNSTMPLTTFIDTLPAGMQVAADPNPSVTCTGTGFADGAVTANAGEGSITLTGGVIGQGGQCTVTVSVVVPTIAGTSQSFTNSVPAGAIGNTRGLTSPGFTRDLTVNAPIGVSKSFNPEVIPVNQPSLMTIVITNSSANSDLTITQFDDVFPPGMILSDPLNAQVLCTPDGDGNTTNGALTDTSDAALAAGATSIRLTGAVAGRSGNCTITANVTATTEATLINQIPANAVQNPGGIGSPAASATLQSYGQLRVSKTVVPQQGGLGQVAPGQWAQFSVTIENYSGAAVTNASITDNLPAVSGLQMVLDNSGGSIPVSDSCNFTFTAGPNENQDGAPNLIGTNGEIPAGSGTSPGSCTVVFRARLPEGATVGASFANTLPVGAVTGTGGQNTNTVTQNVLVVGAVLLTKSFNPDSVAQGQPSTLTLEVRNRTVNALTVVNLTDNLPPGLTLAADPSPTTSNCGAGTLTAFPGSNQIVLTGGTVPARPAASIDVACTITVRVTGSTLGTYTNTVNPGDFSSSGGTIPDPVSANLTITAGLTATKAFSPAATAPGGGSRVTIRLLNQSSGELTNISVNDTGFAVGLTVANPANAATSCAGTPVFTVNPGASFARLDGASLPAGASCDFSFDVTTASGTGPWPNTIPAGNITSAEGPFNSAPATSTLTAATAQIGINKSFNPVIVTGNQPSQLTIDVINSSSVAISGVAFTDVFPNGIQVFAVPDVITNCQGGTVAAIPGGGQVSLVGATLPANTICQVFVTVTSVAFLNLTNTIPAGAISSTGGYTNALPTTATLSTLQGLGVSKGFEPAYIAPDQTSRLRIRLVSTFNPNAINPTVLTGVTFTDVLPEGLEFAANPNATTNCTGGSLFTNPATRALTITGATLAPGGICDVEVDVTAPAIGVYENLIAQGAVETNEGITNELPADADLGVAETPTITKSFDPSAVNVGQSATLIVLITNNANTPLTGVSLTDTLPPGLAVFNPANTSTTCVGGTVAAQPGSSQITLNGATVPANGSCSFRTAVVASEPGALTNTIGAGAISSQQGLTNEVPSSADLPVRSPPGVSKSFSPASIEVDETSTLTINLINDNAAAITLTSALVDALPGNVVVANPPNINDAIPPGEVACPGTVTAPAGSINVTYANGATIPAGGCTITVDVTSSTIGGYVNTIAAGQLRTNAGGNPDPAIATLGVGQPAAPTVRKSFNPSPIDIDGVSRLTITLENPNAEAITLDAVFTDTLPTNLVVQTPNGLGGTCASGSVTAVPGSNEIGFADGATIPAGGCTIEVNVTSGTAGSYTNLIAAGALSTNAGGNPAPATAGIVVRSPSDPTVLKSFAPGTINPGGVSRLTITLGNGNPGSATLTAPLIDTLPDDVVVATNPAVGGTCSGTVTAAAGGATVTYASEATIPSGGCTIQVNVTSTVSGGPYANTIPAGALQTDLGDNGAPATANLFVNPAQPPSVNKSFAPAAIGTGGTSTLTLAFGNGNAGPAILESALVDTLPANVSVANPPNIRVAGGCTLASVVAIAGGSTVTYQADGVIPAGGCSIAVDVTSSVTGVYINTIPTGALETDIGSNVVAATAELGVSAPASISGVVYHDRNGDGQIDPGEEGIGGVLIRLTVVTPTGTITRTTTTAADGSYSFPNLGPGAYTLTQVPPSSWTNVSQTPGAVGGSPSSNIISSIVLEADVNATANNFGNQRSTPPATSIPTLSEWGMIILSLLMVIIVGVMRQRRGIHRF